ncbi:MAG: hypothetical protein ACYC4P_04145 [Thermoanaerobaculia bacterium]
MTHSVSGIRLDAAGRGEPFRLLLPMLALSAALTAEAGPPGCFSPSREGHCIVVKVGGQPTVKLSKETKKMLEPLGGLRFGGGETHYEFASPVRGALEVHAEFVADAGEYFGGPPEVSLHVRPLEGQSLETRPELAAAPNVRIEGGAAVTRSEVVEDNRLPPGKYLLSVRLAGSRNWDRQVSYFEVAK